MTILTKEQMNQLKGQLEAKFKAVEAATKDFAANVEEEVKGPNFKTAVGTCMIGKSISMACENIAMSGSMFYTPYSVFPMFGLFTGGVALLGYAGKQRKAIRELRRMEYEEVLERYLLELKNINNKVERIQLHTSTVAAPEKKQR